MLRQSTPLGVHSDGSRTLMVVFFGANDATAPDYFMHVPLEEYGANLRSIVRRSQDAMPGVTVVIVTPPPIDEHTLSQFEWYAGRNLQMASAYAEEAARAAEATGALLLDLNSLMLSRTDWPNFLGGLHPFYLSSHVPMTVSSN